MEKQNVDDVVTFAAAAAAVIDEDYSVGVCCGVSRGCKQEIVAECQIMTLTFGRSQKFGQAHRT